MSTIKAKIKRIVFASPEGYMIAKTDKNISVKGTVHHDPKELVGVEIEFEGEISENREYKSQDFNFTSYKMQISFSSYFLNKVVKVPLSVTDDVIKTFGDKLQDVIEKTPSKLLTIKGIGEKKLKKIVESYAKNKDMHEIAEFLLPFGISAGRVETIYDFFKKIKKDPIVEIKKNPYTLTKMARVGFIRADEIAKKIGHKVDSPFRIQQGIVHTISDHIDSNGHTYIMKDELYIKSKEVLDCEMDIELKNPKFDLSEDVFLKNLEALLSEKNTQIDMVFESAYSIPRIIKSEQTIFQVLKKYGNHSHGNVLNDEKLEEYINQKESDNLFKFGEMQKNAIRLANKRPSIFFVYGLAGSGKTTVSKDALQIFSRVTSDEKIVVASLSGVAANRAKNVTGFTGKTIHSLLGFQGKEWRYNKDNKLPHDVIMLDECSMVDSALFATLLDAIDFSRTTLMLVGDPAQLQSIGAGDIYANIIDSGLCPGVGLNEVFRQSKDQMINVFATNYVRNGKEIEGVMEDYADFKYYPINIENGFKLKKELPPAEYAKVREANNMSVLKKITDIAHQHKADVWTAIKNKDIFKYVSEFQVISPQKGGVVGVDNLNKILQKILNPSKAKRFIETNENKFQQYDKIIHLKNDNRKTCTKQEYVANKNGIVNFMDNKKDTTRVFNGQIGVIMDVVFDEDEPYAFVLFPNEDYVAMYEKSDFTKRQINLSYAMSIHKSQGSEFNVTVAPVTNSHYKMLNNQLFYTMFTRAKTKLYLVGESYALKRGCTNIADTRRDTILSYLCGRGDGGMKAKIGSDLPLTGGESIEIPPNNGNLLL